MKILITGGTGFTGFALSTRLLDMGHDVVCLDKQEGLDVGGLRRRGAEVVLGSVTEPEVVDRCMKGVEVVHHLAAAFRELDVPASQYFEVNVKGTRNVLRSAVEHGVGTFIYCSTCGVHGDVVDPPADETAPIAPADYYQETKYLGEREVQEVAGGRMRTRILRPAAIYGPGDPERFYMIYRQVARGWFPMFGDGKTLYHPLYIDNLVDAFVRAMDPDRLDGGTYLVADGRYCSIEELVRKVGDALGVDVKIRRLPLWPMVVAGHVVEKACKPFGIEPPVFPRRVDWYRQNRAFDISRAREELRYEPRVGLDEGLRRTAEWYGERGYL